MSGIKSKIIKILGGYTKNDISKIKESHELEIGGLCRFAKRMPDKFIIHLQAMFPEHWEK